MNSHDIYAHSLPDKPPSEWQTLDCHSGSSAQEAHDFAAAFGSGEWAGLTARLHDLGKARASFQAYLRTSNGLTDLAYDTSDRTHSGAGAVWSAQAWPRGNLGRILAYCIAGHHAGLPDWSGGDTPGGALAYRLEQENEVIEEPPVASWITSHQEKWLKTDLRPPWRLSPRTSEISFWIRMLYSCLVDADFLDTEAFMDGGRSAGRAQYPTLTDLGKPFFGQLDAMQRQAPGTSVNRVRAEIRVACEQAAHLPPGLFSLTVPTGGGKTLSSTAFAFRHAQQHGLQRIIYVIPYTSIIEQTADVLRKFLGVGNVVEHHSNFDPEKETQQSRLASENWDAPVIVTTSVQFFESLYACKSSRCRKLHNIAKSVVILDEVQLLPPKLLLPCVEAIRQLTQHYGSSMVLSTATQPALPGLDSIREIIPCEMKLYGRLKRTRIEIPDDRMTRRTWKEVADELQEHRQVLCVVNTRRDCRELHSVMPEGTVHLSASMCGEHRSRVIATIKAMLCAGSPVRVVSTQLVEAGVDIDFPIVFRAYTGLASIAQSAGRCNREGLSDEPGRVVVFMPPQPAPLGDLRKGEDALSELLDRGVDVEKPDSYPVFFDELYKRKGDLGEVFHDLLAKDAPYFQFQFREAAAMFKMIDDQASAAVIVRYDDSDQLIEKLRIIGPKRDIMRRLQRFTVNVPRGMLPELYEKGFVEEIHPGIHVQTLPSLYSKILGLGIWKASIDSRDLII